MKKWMGLLGSLVCFMLFGISAKADVIWEPYEDSFYRNHWEECEHVNRSYRANGPGGEVILYESPESAKEITHWENGTSGYISFTYTDADGIVWGVYNNGDVSESGWMPMEYMVVVYDSISFAEEFDDVIVEENGTLDNVNYEEMYFYSWPGAEQAVIMDITGYVPEYYRTFVDEEGRKWGNVSYHYGIRDHWVCLDAPVAEFDELWPDGAPQRGGEVTEPEDAGKRIVPENENVNKVPFVILMVGVVVVVTAVLLVVLKRSIKKKQ